MWIIVLALAAQAAELRIAIVDQNRRPVTARLEVHGPDGKMYQPAEGSIPSLPPGRSPTGSPYLRSFVTRAGQVTLQVPDGRYKIVAERGLEQERVTVEAGTERPGPVEIRMRPWIDMGRRGWWSGDLHVHRPMVDVPVLLAAEDLTFGAVFTMWNKQNLWGGAPLPKDWIRKTGPRQWMSITNAEDERGGGAWMLHGLAASLGIEKVLEPAARATESWDPPGIEFVRAARGQKAAGGLFPWFDLEKPIWWETPVMMALERPDSMGLLHNHYDQYGMYDNEAWGRKRDLAKFSGAGGFSDYSLHLMYRYWNLGWLVTPSAGAASGVLPNPVGYNRTYVRLDGDFSVEKWYAGLRAGGERVMVSNGPLVFFSPKFEEGRIDGSVEVLSRDPIERVEIVANGTVVQSWKPRSRRFRSKVRVEGAGRHSWVAARAYSVNDLTVRLGHTAPLAIPGGAWDKRADARYFREWIEELARNPKTPRESRAGKLYAEALAVYRLMERDH